MHGFATIRRAMPGKREKRVPPKKGKAVDEQAALELALKRALGLFRAWGRQGGMARAKTLTLDRQREIARKAALARWSKEKGRKKIAPSRGS